jgi:hypothetical protein
MSMNAKQQVVSLLKSIETGDVKPLMLTVGLKRGIVGTARGFE